VVFATGWDGPIDADDDWRYFDFSRATTIVSLGPVPSKLICTAHQHGVRVLRAAVFDINADDPAAFAAWVNETVLGGTENGADGVCVVAVRGQATASASGAARKAVAALRKALPPAAHLSAVVGLRAGFGAPGSQAIDPNPLLPDPRRGQWVGSRSGNATQTDTKPLCGI
jgi:hypothetical protein